jgi:hypothetical protein
MRMFCCLVVACAACVSCHKETADLRAPDSAAAPKTNVVSGLDDKGRPTETIVYATKGVLKQRTLKVTDADGRTLTARTVDSDGKTKWTEQYSYGEAGDHRPVEIRRLLADGQIVSVRFVRSPGGTERRAVTAPDGRQIPEAEQAAFLEQ